MVSLCPFLFIQMPCGKRSKLHSGRKEAPSFFPCWKTLSSLWGPGSSHTAIKFLCSSVPHGHLHLKGKCPLHGVQTIHVANVVTSHRLTGLPAVEELQRKMDGFHHMQD